MYKRFETWRESIEEGPNDPAIFKAIFLAGGPGSGKSFITGKSSIVSLGFKMVNSDIAFERAMQKAGMEMDPKSIFSTMGQAVRGKAKRLTQLQVNSYVKGRLGLVIDGTGKDFDKIKNQASDLKSIGYDVAMIYVNTDLETALDRNKKRARSLPDKSVIDYWKQVQNNIGKFQTFFKQEFLVLDNSEGMDYNKTGMEGYRFATAFKNKEIKNRQAKEWIANAKTKGYKPLRINLPA